MSFQVTANSLKGPYIKDVRKEGGGECFKKIGQNWTLEEGEGRVFYKIGRPILYKLFF